MRRLELPVRVSAALNARSVGSREAIVNGTIEAVSVVVHRVLTGAGGLHVAQCGADASREALQHTTGPGNLFDGAGVAQMVDHEPVCVQLLLCDIGVDEG